MEYCNLYCDNVFLLLFLQILQLLAYSVIYLCCLILLKHCRLNRVSQATGIEPHTSIMINININKLTERPFPRDILMDSRSLNYSNMWAIFLLISSPTLTTYLLASFGNKWRRAPGWVFLFFLQMQQKAGVPWSPGRFENLPLGALPLGVHCRSLPPPPTKTLRCCHLVASTHPPISSTPAIGLPTPYVSSLGRGWHSKGPLWLFF